MRLALETHLTKEGSRFVDVRVVSYAREGVKKVYSTLHTQAL